MDDDWLPTPWVFDDDGQATTPRTRKRTTKKKEFVGWATRELIQFLQSIGKDTSQAMSQYDVNNIVCQYITDNKLIHPEKKKRVMCDVRLQALFGGKKKTVMRNKINDLLESHLLEFHDPSDDDLYSSEEEGASTAAKRQKLSCSDKVAPFKKKPEVSKSSLAAMCLENIKLVYLRRSLIQELLGDPKTFESKVVGSFVRVKSDPYDIFQKNSHQLQLVTGVSAAASAGDNGPTTLWLTGTSNDISISALSDDNISEEECEDLRKRAKDGLLKQPTVGELEQKVYVLHEPITNHWIARELALLNNLIDRANEKGWRYQMTEYLERRMLLQKPEEKSRLVTEIPEVIPEKVEPETVSGDLPNGVNESIDDSPKAADWDWEPDKDSPKAADWDWEPCKQFGQVPLELGTRSNGEARFLSMGEGAQPAIQLRVETNGHEKSPAPGERNNATIEAPKRYCNGHAESLSVAQKDIVNTEPVPVEGNGLFLSSSKEKGSRQENPKTKDVVVITLSDDDEKEKVEIPCTTQPSLLPNPEMLAWYYLDPRNQVQGPFSLTSLKWWSDLRYFTADFKVWMSGQTPEDAILLTDILQLIFPRRF